MYQIIDFYWKHFVEGNKYIPTLRLFNKASEEFSNIELPKFHFHFGLSEEKFCTGYISENGHQKCMQNNRINSFETQCNVCEGLEGFKSAFFFKGKPNTRMGKHLAQNHYLYLAYFEPGIIKVGTAAFSRRFVRLMEQDALIYAFIAKSDGFNIQNIERYISKNFNISESIKSSHKLKYLNRKVNVEFATRSLNQLIDRIFAKMKKDILVQLQSELFKRSEIFIQNLSDNPSVYYPNSFTFHKDELNIFGLFQGLRGRYLIIKNDQSDHIFDTNFLIGRRISYTDDFKYISNDPDSLFGKF